MWTICIQASCKDTDVDAIKLCGAMAVVATEPTVDLPLVLHLLHYRVKARDLVSFRKFEELAHLVSHSMLPEDARAY